MPSLFAGVTFGSRLFQLVPKIDAKLVII